MKIYAVILENGIRFKEWSDLNHITYLLRGAALEYTKETSTILKDRVDSQKFLLFKYEEYHFHVYKGKISWRCLVTDTDYSRENAFLLLAALRIKQDIKHQLDNFKPDGKCPVFEEKTFVSIFKDGETMDDIVENSGRLSTSARHVYKTRNLYPAYCNIM